MASSGIIAEFARKSPAVKVGIFAAIALVLGGLYYQFLYAGIRRDIVAAEEQSQALVDDEKKLDADEKEFEELTDKQNALERLISENEAALPTAAQLPAFFDMLQRKIGEASVEVRRWDHLAEIPVDETTMKVPVEISIQGTFYELKKFFHLLYKMNQSERDEPTEAPPESPEAVEERDRIVTIEDLEIGEPVVRNGELVLIATFRASTFRKDLPEAEVPEDTKKKAKDTKGKGAATDAKTRTEDAMKKSEDRAGGADRVKGGM